MAFDAVCARHAPWHRDSGWPRCDVETLVFSGLVGVKRRDAQGGFVTVEFPHDAPISPGDVVSLAQRPDLPLIVESYTPATDNAPLGKARCVFRVGPPRAK